MSDQDKSNVAKLLELANKQRQLAEKLKLYSQELKKLEDHNKLEEEDLEKAQQLEELIEKIESIEVRLFNKDQANKQAFLDLKKTIEDSKRCLNDIKHHNITKLVKDADELFKDSSILLEDVAKLLEV